jgi:hypothetical protein
MSVIGLLKLFDILIGLAVYYVKIWMVGFYDDYDMRTWDSNRYTRDNNCGSRRLCTDAQGVVL